MKTGDSNGTTLRFPKAPEQKRCPECGEEMKTVKQCHESGVLFVWYECGKDNCDGQWLQKIPKKSQNNPVPDISK